MKWNELKKSTDDFDTVQQFLDYIKTVAADVPLDKLQFKRIYHETFIGYYTEE